MRIRRDHPDTRSAKDELISYAGSVIERFGNPYIKHYLSSIALNSVSKFKVRVLPSILEYIKRYGETPKTLVFALAKLLNAGLLLVRFARANQARNTVNGKACPYADNTLGCQ